VFEAAASVRAIGGALARLATRGLATAGEHYLAGQQTTRQREALPNQHRQEDGAHDEATDQTLSHGPESYAGTRRSGSIGLRITWF
jgi:hypothetical protein